LIPCSSDLSGITITWDQLLEFHRGHPTFKAEVVQGQGADTCLYVSKDDYRLLARFLGLPEDETMTDLKRILAEIDEQAKQKPGSPAEVVLPRGLEIKVNYNVDGRFAIQLMRVDTWPSDQEFEIVVRSYPGLMGMDPELVKQFSQKLRNKERRYLQAWYANYPGLQKPQLSLDIGDIR